MTPQNKERLIKVVVNKLYTIKDFDWDDKEESEITDVNIFKIVAKYFSLDTEVEQIFIEDRLERSNVLEGFGKGYDWETAYKMDIPRLLKRIQYLEER